MIFDVNFLYGFVAGALVATAALLGLAYWACHPIRDLEKSEP